MDAWFRVSFWFGLGLNYFFVRVCFGVGLGFVLGWFGVYLGLV